MADATTQQANLRVPLTVDGERGGVAAATAPTKLMAAVPRERGTPKAFCAKRSGDEDLPRLCDHVPLAEAGLGCATVELS